MGPAEGVDIIGAVAPGDAIPLPLDWREKGKFLLLRPLTGEGAMERVLEGGLRGGGGGEAEEDSDEMENGAILHGWCKHSMESYRKIKLSEMS